MNKREKMMEKKSFISVTVIMLLIQMFFLILTMLIFLYSSYKVGDDERKRMMENSGMVKTQCRCLTATSWFAIALALFLKAALIVEKTNKPCLSPTQPV